MFQCGLFKHYSHSPLRLIYAPVMSVSRLSVVIHVTALHTSAPLLRCPEHLRNSSSRGQCGAPKYRRQQTWGPSGRLFDFNWLSCPEQETSYRWLYFRTILQRRSSNLRVFFVDFQWYLILWLRTNPNTHESKRYVRKYTENEHRIHANLEQKWVIKFTYLFHFFVLFLYFPSQTLFFHSLKGSQGF